jgi:predicted amidohydrolase
MSLWKIAAVQIDCRLGDVPFNLRAVRAGLRDAAGLGAQMAVFPECVLTGYCFESRAEAQPFAEPAPGRSVDAVAADCRELGIWAVVGMLERDDAIGGLFNACALVGPAGFVATYRKIHLPYLGVDRFTTPGDRPFAVHDLGGLRVGMHICYDGGFPESARVLTVLGADLLVLPTNWPTGAAPAIIHLAAARALENHVYYAACNRVGDERGFRFIGQSRIIDCNGELLATAGADAPEIVMAAIDPAVARNKRLVKIPGKYELDRVGDRRPEMYRPLCEPRRPADCMESPPSA